MMKNWYNMCDMKLVLQSGDTRVSGVAWTNCESSHGLGLVQCLVV